MPEAKILLIEGERAGKLSLAAALLRSDYEVWVVHTGTDALAKMQQVLPDLVVFDASTMRSSGVRSCNRIRQLLGERPLIYARAEQQPAEADIEADLFLERPFTARKVLNRIRVLLPANRANEEIIRCGQITYYRSKRSILLPEQTERQLTPKLAQLFEEFLRYPNQIISRRQLMENVWQTTYIGDTRTLDVHIRWIRECIESDPAYPRLLRTVRGQGYIFAIPD